MIALLWQNGAVIAGLMFVVWLASLMLRDVSIIDGVWGLGFVVVAWTSWYLAEPEKRQLLLPLLVSVWGLRLSGYLAWRNFGEPEDKRYRSMRDKWGSAFPLVSLLTVFALQGAVMWVVSLPVQLAQLSSTDLFTNNIALTLTIVGSVLFVVGFVFEAVGDWQLARFKADPANKGKVMDGGLWHYTRHPNYFGDFCAWWGFYLVALAYGTPWLTIVGPVIMSLFLMRVSGVTLLEKSLKKDKPDYAKYVARTNAFFPGPPR